MRRKLGAVLVVSLFIIPMLAPTGAQALGPPLISTFAGGANSGDGGPGAAAALDSPGSFAFDNSGNIYFVETDGNRVWRFNGGVVHVVAGNGINGYSGDGGPAVNAQLSTPQGLALFGNLLYISDSGNYRIRRVDLSTGIITTFAGTGWYGPGGGDGGPATSASVTYPIGVAVDGTGRVFFVEQYGPIVRMVDTSGIISTVAGMANQYGYSGDGGAATSAHFYYPTGIAIDDAGELFISDTSNQRVRKVDTSGNISTVAGDGTQGFFGDGGSATAANLDYPQGIDVSGDGNTFYFADVYNSRIRVVTSGTIDTFAGDGSTDFGGDGGAPTAAMLYYPTGVGIAPSGEIYIGDTSNHRVRRVQTGIIQTVAGTGSPAFKGDGGSATAAMLFRPRDVAFDSGNTFIADHDNDRVRKVDTGGTITTVVGNGICCTATEGDPATAVWLNGPVALAFDSSHNLYIADSSCRVRRVVGGLMYTFAGTTCGFAGDGGPATSAKLSSLASLVFDGAGNLIIGDSGNNRIRQVTPGGTITTIAGTGGVGPAGDGGLATNAAMSDPSGLAILGGDIVFADGDTNEIRRINHTTNIITRLAGISDDCCFTVSGTPALQAVFDCLHGLASDASGNLYVTDRCGERIYRIDSAGIVTLVAGNGQRNSAGDGGAASAARIAGPRGIELDASRNIFFAEGAGYAVRRITALQFQPDELVKYSSDAGYLGDNIRNTTAVGQTRTVPISHGVTRTFYAVVQNEAGVMDSIRLNGTPGGGGFTVNYYYGSTNITAAVTGGGYTLPAMTPGATRSIKILMKDVSAPVGANRTAALNATARGDTTKRDSVRTIVDS